VPGGPTKMMAHKPPRGRGQDLDGGFSVDVVY
jgi:hypothetical protein